MNKENLIKLATECGFTIGPTSAGQSRLHCWPIALEKFANVIAQNEREECAKICDDQHDDQPSLTQFMSGQYVMAEYLAERIRARTNNV